MSNISTPAPPFRAAVVAAVMLNVSIADPPCNVAKALKSTVLVPSVYVGEPSRAQVPARSSPVSVPAPVPVSVVMLEKSVIAAFVPSKPIVPPGAVSTAEMMPVPCNVPPSASPSTEPVKVLVAVMSNTSTAPPPAITAVVSSVMLNVSIADPPCNVAKALKSTVLVPSVYVGEPSRAQVPARSSPVSVPAPVPVSVVMLEKSVIAAFVPSKPIVPPGAVSTAEMMPVPCNVPPSASPSTEPVKVLVAVMSNTSTAPPPAITAVVSSVMLNVSTKVPP